MINVEKDFLKDIGNGIYLKDSEINCLKRYDIDPKNCKDIKELIYKIEDTIDNSYEEEIELEMLSERLQEFNYYNNTNK